MVVDEILIREFFHGRYVPVYGPFGYPETFAGIPLLESLAGYFPGIPIGYGGTVEVKMRCVAGKELRNLGPIYLTGLIEPWVKDGDRVKMRSEDGQRWVYGRVSTFYHRRYAVWDGLPTATELPNPFVMQDEGT